MISNGQVRSSGSLTGGIGPFGAADAAKMSLGSLVRVQWQDGWVVVLVAVALAQVASIATSRLVRRAITRRWLVIRSLSNVLPGGAAGVGLGIAQVTA